MGLKADRSYAAVVAPGSQLIESAQKGTLGYQILLDYVDTDGNEEQTSHTVWLTPATVQRAEDMFRDVLGIDIKNLRNANYVDMQLCQDIAGKRVSFTTRDEGEYGIKVAFLNRPKAASGASPAKLAAALFGGKPVTNEDRKQGTAFDKPVTAVDDDIPF